MRFLSRLRPLRVVIDSRMADGSGGVQQWVIGLAAALSRLDGSREEYRFLVNEGQGAWLQPYLAGRCSLLVHRESPIAVAPAVALAPASVPASAPAPARALAPARGGGARRARRALGARFPVLRRIRRRLRPARPPVRLSPFDQTILAAATDVVHFPRPSASTTLLPNIYQPWDLQHRHLPEFFSPDALPSRDATYRRYCEQATLIVVATRWVKDDVVAQYGIAPDRIAVVNPPPVTNAYAAPTRDEEDATAARLGLPARYAFYPAQTWGHKNHERLFEAVQRLRARGIDVPLVCPGLRNERYPALLRLAADLGIGDLVMFPGFLAPAEIQVLYRRATCLVFPSLYEGWGLPIMEAFDAGLPVACSNVTSLPALVGEAGLVFDPTDPEAIASAIERLWTNASLRTELVARGRVRLRQFDWHTTALTMRAHYRRLAGRSLEASELTLLATRPIV